jgi:hypothetical protein
MTADNRVKVAEATTARGPWGQSLSRGPDRSRASLAPRAAHDGGKNTPPQAVVVDIRGAQLLGSAGLDWTQASRIPRLSRTPAETIKRLAAG